MENRVSVAVKIGHAQYVYVGDVLQLANADLVSQLPPSPAALFLRNGLTQTSRQRGRHSGDTTSRLGK